MRCNSFPTSVHRNLTTTRRRRLAVAIAHGLEFFICLLFKRLEVISCVLPATEFGEGRAYEIRFSTDDSKDEVFNVLRNKPRFGA